jgi:hypothetical protein
MLDATALRDPEVCKSCHSTHYDEWSGSMHAYASDDPIFLAMNRRAQRETNGALGPFCVRCHAPLAVQQGLTKDGLNLGELPQAKKGVTCFFCHAAESLDGTHNNPLMLATDGRLFGPFGDPASGIPHRGFYSPMMDETRAESAAACGSCHDIVNQHGAAVERTFQEWQQTLFAKPPLGLTCASGCHMTGRDGPASTVSTKIRRLHDHSFPAVDVALTAFPQMDAQRRQVQQLLDSELQATLCVDNSARAIEVTLDNVGAGHGWPSGATPDRRVWVEVTASAGDKVIYQSGVLAPGETLENSSDPDLWLIRDCIYGEDRKEVKMFWEAASVITNQLPGSVTPVITDVASFTKSHIRKVYPGAGVTLSQVPDRVTLKVFMKAVGDDILSDLVASGDLDPAIPPLVPTFPVGGATLEWTPQLGAPPPDLQAAKRLSCVTAGRYVATPNLAVSHAHCE